MATRPSEPLLNLLRTVAQKKGLNTAALAKAAGIERAHLKHVLSGAEALTVDELVQIAEVLEIGAGDLAGLPAELTAPEPAPDDGGSKGPELMRSRRGGAALATVDNDGPEMPQLDPYGNHAEQILKLGLALGIDIYLLLNSSELGECGVPRAVLQKYPERLPIHLEAAYHRHHDPSFLPDGLKLKLSFDALYDCTLPWTAFHQVTLFPLPPDPPAAPEPPPEKDEKPTLQRGHLRLVE